MTIPSGLPEPAGPQPTLIAESKNVEPVAARQPTEQRGFPDESDMTVAADPSFVVYLYYQQFEFLNAYQELKERRVASGACDHDVHEMIQDVEAIFKGLSPSLFEMQLLWAIAMKDQ